MPSKAVPRMYREGESFELYVNHFNRIARANEWEEEATKIAHLETKLTGKALRHFEVFIEEEPAISFTDMTEKLVEELGPSTQKALEKFSQMKLGDQSPKEFYGALVAQSKIAHGEMGQEARHMIVKTQLLQALPQRLKRDAAKQGYLADLGREGLLELITRVYDAEMRDESGQYEPEIATVQPSSVASASAQGLSVEQRLQRLEESDKVRSSGMEKMMVMVKEMHEKLQQPSSGVQRGVARGTWSPKVSGPVNCYRCLQDGHMMRDCPNAVRCSKCREEGHMRAKCQKN